ncbi:MAG: 3-isopropylmalate dehydratase small subunit [candidate division Zixibacteria bacterium]|nr:3-isopropylmalate dehydratase small subunit [candidate division Zixibacteria bacterium]
MLKEIKGRVWKFGDNIDTDLIYPGKCLPILDPQEMAKHALEGYDKEFPNKIQKGDIILAGSNFGCGSSREQAATSLKFAGISCVIAKSFSRIFFRNAINQGLALVQSKETYDLIEGGEIITVNYVSGEIITENKNIPFPPLPDIVMGILEDGGLIEHLKKSLKK